MNYADAYGQMHQNDKYFPGYSITPHLKAIAAIIDEHAPRNLLDFGSGKGYQYLVRRVHESWGGLLPYCYDVGVRHLSVCPPGPFDGIICTDVLEHIEEQDLPELLSRIRGLMNLQCDCFTFFSISCSPAKKKLLPDGRNVHVTVRPPKWWRALVDQYLPGAYLCFEDVPDEAEAN